MNYSMAPNFIRRFRKAEAAPTSVSQSFALSAAFCASCCAFGLVPQEVEVLQERTDSPGIGLGQSVLVLVLSLGRGIGEELGVLFHSNPVSLKLPDDLMGSRLSAVAWLMVASVKERKVNPVRSKFFTIVAD
jgi:hypothetical protein